MAGLAMGMIVFIIASGLTLVFGLMDVLNFGHGVFIALGAFRRHPACSRASRDWTGSGLAGAQLRRRLPCDAGRDGGGRARSGYAFERVIVRPVYGQHLKQILITMGGMIVGEEIIKLIWGPAQLPRCRCPRCCAVRC